jgi:hypothetical protein
MTENKIFETQSAPSGVTRTTKYTSPVLTLKILRGFANASMLIAIVGGSLFFLSLVGSISNGGNPTGWMFLTLIAFVAQGFMVYAVFHALALIVENLVAIREK